MQRKKYVVGSFDSSENATKWMNERAREGYTLSALAASGSGSNYHLHKKVIVMEMDR